MGMFLLVQLSLHPKYYVIIALNKNLYFRNNYYFYL